MKYRLAVLFFISATSIVDINAQCKSGDCNNGQGIMDFGYAVYEGSFKNGKPDGFGVMDYGDGNKFQGNWLDGMENGRGLVFDKGVARQVEYKNGVLQYKGLGPIEIGGSKKVAENIPGCESGDCANGTGIIKFPSGNRYEGEFRNYQFHGKGKMTYASGNIIEAEFINHAPKKGTFFYKSDNTLFTGTFDERGEPYDGIYVRQTSGVEVYVEKGQVVNVRNPAKGYDEKQIAEEKKQNERSITCLACGGKGFKTTVRKFSYDVGGIGRVGASGYVTWDYYPQTISRESKSTDICTQCEGNGKISPNQAGGY